MNRRPYKEGSIYKQGDKWVASISFTDRLSGKRIRRRKHAETKTEAVRLLKTMKATHGTSGRLPDEQRTIAQAIKHYTEHRRSNPDLSEGTHEKDDWMRNLILDGLGKCKTNELTLPDSVGLRFPPFSGHLVKQLLGLRVVDWFRTLPGFGSQGLSGADRCCTG